MWKKQIQVIFINLGEEGISGSPGEKGILLDDSSEKENQYNLPEKNRTSLFVGEAENQYRYDSPKEDVFKQLQSRYTTETDIAEAAYKSVMQEAYQFLNEYKVARNHKDLLLRAIFRNKEEMLSLYNGLNGSSYTDASALEITTLENAVYMSVQNDVSFVFLSEVYMIEHQSSVNPNMPLRNLQYITKVLSMLTAEKDIYGSRLISLLTPRFVVLYNGTEQLPEKTVLRLSDAYEKKQEEPELELITTVLNINEGYNEGLKNACRLLKDYTILITKIREKQKTMELQYAVYLAIEECIREDVLKEFLVKHRAEVLAMMLYDYDMEKHIKSEKAYEYERGMERGIEQGIEKNTILMLRNLMQTMNITEAEAKKYLKLE